MGCDSVSPTRQEAEEITPHPALQQYLSGPGRSGMEGTDEVVDQAMNDQQSRK